MSGFDHQSFIQRAIEEQTAPGKAVVRVSEHAHAVENGIIHHVSPTQIQTYDVQTYGGCEARWFQQKVLRIPTKQTKSQLLGVDMHAQAENYLNTGTDTLGPIARAGKHFMPTPMTWILVEVDAGKQRPIKAAGIHVEQRIDVVGYSERYIDNQGQEHDDPGTIEVVDWKTTSDLRYAKGSDELASSVQMISYAEWVVEQKRYWRDAWDIDLERVRVSHGNFRTRGAPAALKTTTSIGLPELAVKWSRIEGVAERMKATARLTLAEVPKNLDACNAYGGCPFRDVCPRPMFADFNFEGGNPAMFDDMFSSAPSAPPPVPITMPRPAVSVPAHIEAELASAHVAAEIAKLEAEERAAKAPTAAETLASIPVISKAEGERLLGQMPQARRSVGVLPPDAPQSTPANAALPIPPEELATMHPAIQLAAEQFAAEGATVTVKAPDVGPGEGHTGGTMTVVHQVGEAGGVVGEIVPAKPKRGRPPKPKAPPTVAEKDAIGAALDVAAAAGASTAQIQAAVAGAVEREAAEAVALDQTIDVKIVNGHIVSEIRNGIEIYVDVLLAGITAGDLEPYIAARCEALAKKGGVADIRFAAHDHPLAFGRWKGALAAAVKADPPAPGAYLVTDVRESEIRQVVVEALRPLCASYVRGR